MDGWMIALLVVGFVGFFALMFVLVFRIMAWLGWSRLERHFSWDRPVPDGATLYSWQTIAIGEFPRAASYRNAMNVWLDDAGVYLRPPAAFAAFHPLLHIDWRRIDSVEPRKLLAIKSYRVLLDQGAPPITMAGRSGEAVFERWSRQGRAP